MKMKTLALLLGCLCMLHIARAISVELQPVVAVPGERADIFITIVNTQNMEIKDIYVTLHAPNGFVVKTDNPVYVSSLSQGEATSVYFSLLVPKGAEERSYRAEVSVKYRKGYSEEEEEKTFYITVRGVPDFYLSSDASVLEEGKENRVKVVVTNRGSGKAEECSLYAIPSMAISPVGSGKYFLGDMPPGASRTLYLELYARELPRGIYVLPLEVVCIGSGGVYTQNVTLSFLLSGKADLSIANVITSPDEIRPGDRYVKIMATIFNSGEETAKDVKVELNVSSPFEDSWSNCNRIFVGMLKPGDARKLVFVVNIDEHAKSGKYKVPLIIFWKDPDGEEHVSRSFIEIEIKPKPIFKVEALSNLLYAGETGKIKIRVKNIGGEKAEDVKVTAIKSSSLPFDYPKKSDTVGELYPGESGEAVIIASVDKDAVEKEYSITLQIRAIGDREKGDDNVYVVQKSIKVKVVRKTHAEKTLFFVLAFSACCVFAFAVFRMLKPTGRRKGTVVYRKL